MSLILQVRFRAVLIPLVRMVTFKFFVQFQWIAFPTQSCQVLYSFYANLQHSLIILLIVLSLWRCFVLLLEEIQFLS